MTVKITKTVTQEFDVWAWLLSLAPDSDVWKRENASEEKELREIVEDYRTAVKQYNQLVRLKPERLASYALQFDDAVKVLENRLKPILKDYL